MSAATEDLSVPMSFNDIAVREVPVKLGDKDYVLREPTGWAAVEYRNALSRAARFDPGTGKFAGMGNIADAEPLLVSRCLYSAGNPQPVALEFVKALPSKIIAALFERAKKMGGLDEADTKESLKAKIAKAQADLAELDGAAAETTLSEDRLGKS